MVALERGVSFDLDASRLIALGARQKKRKHAVPILRLDAVGIEFDGDRYRSVELSEIALASMEARAILVIGRFRP